MIYLDYQATTPLAPEALDAMLPWLRDGFANPHSPHRAGRTAKAAVEVARGEVARLLPTGGRVAFTSGATEALNWAIKGTTGGIVTLATEHAAVLDTVAAEAARGRAVTVLPVGQDGMVDLDMARAAIVPGTELVAAMLVNNEIGVIQPVAMLADLAHQAGALILAHNHPSGVAEPSAADALLTETLKAGDALLLTYTFGTGEVPKSTDRFLKAHAAGLRGVVASGSYHWGHNFARAADLIAAEYGVPIVAKLNKGGTTADRQEVLRWLHNAALTAHTGEPQWNAG